MRAIWKGAIAFGLVNVPVKVYSATEDHDISLHQVHNADGGRIRYQRRCEVCGEIIDYADIDKAYEEDGRTVVLTRDELKSIPAESSNEIEVVEFVPSEQMDPIMFEKSYYLEPDSKSPKAYVLLRSALEDTDRMAVVQFALREKTRLGVLRIRDDVLVLQSLLWPDEVREASFPSLDTSVKISSQERDMSAALVESMASDFEPEKFTDEYQVQLRQLIEAKLEQGEALDTEATFGVTEQAGTGEVIDLMEALKRSLDKKRGGGEVRGSEEDTGAASKTAASRSAAATSSASKSTATKSTTGKATDSKTTASKTTASKATAAKAATPATAPAKATAGKAPAKKTAASTDTGTETKSRRKRA
jgi:DNA end-binding protein Ku